MNSDNNENYARNENEVHAQSTAIVHDARGEWGYVVSKDEGGQIGYRGMEVPMSMARDEYLRMVE